MKIMLVSGRRCQYALNRPIVDELQRLKMDYVEVVDSRIKPYDFAPKSENRITGMGHTFGFWELAYAIGKPDVVLVQGDTIESMMAATVAVQENIPIAHLYGGDITQGGEADDKYRFAITAMADTHFPNTKKSAGNLKRVGVNPEKIFLEGDPIFDYINAVPAFDDTTAYPEVLGVFHVEYAKHSPSPEVQVLKYVEIMQKFKAAGHTIQALASGGEADAIVGDRLGEVLSLDVNKYYEYLSQCKLLVGNTSSGIAEAPSYGVWFYHLGSRQLGREHAKNVIWVRWLADHNAYIDVALTRMAGKPKRFDNPYDTKKDCLSAKRILYRLESIYGGN